MDFAVESLEENWNEFILLAVDRWHETGRKHGQKFTPSYTKFVQHEQAGRVLMCTARVKDVMVGYAIKGDGGSHFVLPRYRKSEAGLLKFAEDQLEACCV